MIEEKFILSIAKLSNLNLSKNPFTSIPDCFLPTAPLTSVNTSKSALVAHPSTLLQMGSVLNLKVNGNVLNEIPSFKLATIRDIDLSFNCIETLPNTFGNAAPLTISNFGFKCLKNYHNHLRDIQNWSNYEIIF
jgi:hypothetical protein